VYAGRGLARLVHQHRVLPGRRAVVAGEGAEAEALAALLREAGCEVVAVVGLEPGPRGRLVKARGRAHVAGAVIADASGAEQKVACDLVAVAGRGSALVDLARHAGAHVAWRDGSFVVITDDAGATRVAGVWACGEIRGPCSPVEAAAQGERAGRSAAAFAAGGAR
jgi:sarcosine oxidase subunit alpha